MKKTALCMVLVLSLILSLTSCGNVSGYQFPSTLSMDTLYPILNEGRATLISSDAGGNTNESAAMLFDGDLSTKLCTDNSEYVITWKLNRAYPIGGYTITTANDTAENGRLPRGWNLEASTDGINWVMVSSISNSRLEERNFTDYFYTFSKVGMYQYFRFTLTAGGSRRNPMTQMAEITLYGPERAEALLSEVDLSDNTYASTGMELLKTMINDYYDRESHTVRYQLGREDAAEVWGVASFLEALAEGYRLCPEDELIYNTYVDVLNYALTTYKAERTIETASGKWDVIFYNTTPKGSDDYRYDYNAWICIQYLNAYHLLDDSAYLRRAEDLLDFLWTGWDESKLDGGISLAAEGGTKSAASNAPVATAFLSAYEITQFEDYLVKAKKIYDWCRATLLEDNLYCDSVNRRGELNDWKAAYNQGAMLTAGSLLYKLTGEVRYLQETRATYNATVELMFTVSGNYASMNGDPIYKGCCIGWLQRGFILFQEVSGDNTTTGTEYMNNALDFNLRTKDGNGYYDPYFRTGAWSGESTREVLQPSGVASTYLLAGLYAAD